MKKIFTCLPILLLLSLSLSIIHAQNILYSEDFNGASNTWSLSTVRTIGGVTSKDNTGPNYWIVNDVYTGGCGYEFLGTCIRNINSTPDEPAEITLPGNNYMHILGRLHTQTSDPAFNSNVNPAGDSNVPSSQYYFTEMSNDISTSNQSGVQLTFWWLNVGDVNNYAQLFYSTDGGANWTLGIDNMRSQSTWTQTTFPSSPGIFDDLSQLRIGFRFVTIYNLFVDAEPIQPSIAIDDIKIISALAPTNSISTGTVSPASFCACSNVNVPFTSTGTFTAPNNYTVQLSNSSGSFASPVVIGTSANNISNSGTISCVIPCGSPTGNKYRIRVVSDNPSFTGTDNGTDITINANLASSLSIAANPGGSVCSATPVTFTATPANGGSTPNYQWYLNTFPISGETNSTYTSSLLINGNQVSCVMTSSLACATGSPTTSNTIGMTVTTGPTASVSISASPSGAICAGTPVTFTATPINGGTTPGYQWMLNGFVVFGQTNSTLTRSNFLDEDEVTCVMTSNAACATSSPATSNDVTMTVNLSLPASVSISANPSGAICAGAMITFTAVPIRGGSTPGYQWQLNGSPLSGQTNSTYSSTSLNNNDQVSCILTSSAACVTGSPATSSAITVTVNAILSASVGIAASPSGPICTGTPVTFTATPVNGGSSPGYQWQLNGSPIGGETNSTYTSSTLNNTDQVTCIMTSSFSCATGSPATSNNIIMGVNAIAPASVSISAFPAGAVCAGTPVTFTAAPTNGGSAPGYQWQLNGIFVTGQTNSTYVSSTLNNNAQVNLVLTSNAACSTGSPAISNNVTMTVNANLPAAISILSNPSGTICAGTPVIFTAAPSNGGAPPGYHWKLNGNDITGETNATYNTTTLNNNDQVTCVMASSLACVSGSPATSNTVTATVNLNLPVSVTITASPAGSVCAGTLVTFSTTSLNAGSTPTYQWQLNGLPISGQTNDTYSRNNSVNGDDITCIMTSSSICTTGSPANSNTITMSVNLSLPASVSVTASPVGAICEGTSVTFNATPSGGGTTPGYQWKLNGSPISGQTNSSYSSNSLNNNDQLSCVMTSGSVCATGSPATSNTATVTVNPNLPVSVSISPNPNGAVCAGTPVTFSASPTNGGATPAYQWRLNGSPITGETNSTYTSSILNNGDEVLCSMTSTLACATGSPATSNTVTITVNPNLPSSVNISSNTNGTICAGTPVIFIATSINGGTAPAYQWKINGTPISGETNSTYTSAFLNNNDQAACSLTSNAVCATGSPATSNLVTMTVNANHPADVSITASPNGAICSGSPVIFTAMPTNGGTPAYQWKLNGNILSGETSSIYTNSSLTNNDEVSCIMTSSLMCSTGSPATSNAVDVIVNTNVPVSVNISPDINGAICAGTSVTFTANPVNGGIPAYQWQLNGSPVTGQTNSSYTNGSFNNNDEVSCELVSSATCATGSPATSNTVTMTVNPNLPASVTVSANPSGAICSSTSVTFTATPINGGTPSCQWELNGNTISGETNFTYTNTVLDNNDEVLCVMTSTATCATSSPATSNTLTMIVNATLPVSVGIASDPSGTICSGTPVSFTASPDNGGVTPLFQWQLNGNSINGATSSTYTSSNLSNNDELNCIMTPSTACATGSPATSNSITENVKDAAKAGAITSPKSSICENTFAHLSDNGSSGGDIQWQASSAATSGFSYIAGASNNSYTTPILTDSIHYRVVVSNGTCADTTQPYLIAVLKAPVASFTSSTNGHTISFDGSPSTGAISYSWDFNDGTTSTLVKPIHTFDSVKTYHVCLTVANISDCNFTICQNVPTFFTGTNEIKNETDWLVYPDPFTSILYISAGKGNVYADVIELYDVLGRKTFEKPINGIMDNPLKVDVTGIKDGIYYLRIKTKDGDYIRSVIKQ